MSASGISSALQAGYRDWKSWEASAFFRCGSRQRAYFDREFAAYDFSNRRVLEIGFGNGELLRWLADHGAILSGFEIDPCLNDAARRTGIVVVDPSDPGDSDAFDYILLFDVLEHLSRAALVSALKTYARLLAPDGVIIARFPNAQSPFASVYQHGDATHQGSVSAAILGQLAPSAGLRLAMARRPRAAIAGGPLRRVAGAGRHLLQRIIERSLALSYAFEAPLSPNVVVELRRLPVADEGER